MTEKYQIYRQASYPLPARSLAWNIYGAGLDHFGRDGKPELLDTPQEPGDDQLLVRIDSVGMCFSDIKIVKQGRNHPKLYNRDLSVHPTRLGHEVSLTVIQVGKNLQERYYPGQRLAVQPDIYQNGKSTAYGYTVPGGLIQYHLIGPEVLETDEGACLLPVDAEMGYAEASLLEPWGCVLAAYTQRRRLEPKVGGTMWIAGRQGDDRPYQFSSGLDAPRLIVLTDVPAAVKALVTRCGAQVLERNGLSPDEYEALSDEATGGKGFDDIILLEPRSARAVGAAARLIARRGTLNMVGCTPLDGPVEADLGRLHYDYIAFVGSQGPDIAASYGEARNRCELRPGGTAVFVGAGGPMGQMHVQRALEQPDGPRLVVATEISDERLETLKLRFAPLAQKNGRELVIYNPNTAAEGFHDFIMRLTAGEGADDVVVCVPSAPLMVQAAGVMKPDGMLVLFAGVPNGTLGALDLSAVYLGQAQYTGTSGLTIHDQKLVMERARQGALSPGRSVAAIGGMDRARDALVAVMEGRYPGKVVIFPQLSRLPLLSLDELKERYPQVAARLGEGDVWTPEAEEVLIDLFWDPPQ